MKNNSFIINILLTMSFVVTTGYVGGMDTSYALINEEIGHDAWISLVSDYYQRNHAERAKSDGMSPSDVGKYLNEMPSCFNSRIVDYRQESLAAAEYNSHNMLLSLPNKIFHLIVTHSVDTTKPLKEIVKPCLLLSTVCKKFNSADLLMAIGKRCFCYDITEKNDVMKKLLFKTNDINYWNRRNGALLMIGAGADNDCDPYSLLARAIHYKDKEMITFLFKNNVSVNQKPHGENPDFFSIKKVEIAQMFINKGLDLKAHGADVLRSCIVQDRSLALFKLYLQNGADPRKIQVDYNECIMHLYARYCDTVYDTEKHKSIGELLLKAAPDIINTVNNKGETPLDIVENIIKNKPYLSSKNRTLCQDSIVLFKMYGAKTAQQLKQDELL